MELPVEDWKQELECVHACLSRLFKRSKPKQSQPGVPVEVEQAVVSQAAILLSENVQCWLSLCRGNPTRFAAHVLNLDGDLFCHFQKATALNIRSRFHYP